MSQLMPSIDF